MIYYLFITAYRVDPSSIKKKLLKNVQLGNLIMLQQRVNMTESSPEIEDRFFVLFSLLQVLKELLYCLALLRHYHYSFCVNAYWRSVARSFSSTAS